MYTTYFPLTTPSTVIFYVNTPQKVRLLRDYRKTSQDELSLWPGLRPN